MAPSKARKALICRDQLFRNKSCEKDFRNISELKAHRESQHLGIRYRCSCSGHDFTRLQYVVYHIRTENDAAARENGSMSFKDVYVEGHALMPCIVLPGYHEFWTKDEHEEFGSKLTTPPGTVLRGKKTPQSGMTYAWRSKPKSEKSRIPRSSSVPGSGSSDEATAMPFPTQDTSIEDGIHLPTESWTFMDWPEEGEDFGQPSTLDDSIAYSQRESPSKDQGPSTAFTSMPEHEQMADEHSTNPLHSETAAASKTLDFETLLLLDINAMDGRRTDPADDFRGAICRKPGQCQVHDVDPRMRALVYDCMQSGSYLRRI